MLGRGLKSQTGKQGIHFEIGTHKAVRKSECRLLQKVSEWSGGGRQTCKQGLSVKSGARKVVRKARCQFSQQISEKGVLDIWVLLFGAQKVFRSLKVFLTFGCSSSTDSALACERGSMEQLLWLPESALVEQQERRWSWN